MKIAFFSDLHLEFCRQGYPFDFPDADVCILVGDICVAAMLKENRTDANARNHKGVVGRFLTRLFQKYERVFYVMGNHEHYHGDFKQTKQILTEFIHNHSPEAQDKMFLLDCDKFVHGGVVFLGCSLWTDFNGASPTAMNAAQFGLNDYRMITNGNPMLLLKPQDTLEEHRKHVEWIEAQLNIENFVQTIDQVPMKIVMIGHHAPSKKSVHPHYAADVEINGAYQTNLEWLMDGKIALWLHGHTHNEFDYIINGTRIMCNPMGYLGVEQNKQFQPDMVVEV